MLKFITTQGINYYLENIIKNAKEEIILVSPYIHIQRRLKELLIAQKNSGVKITIICRTNDLKESISAFANEIHNSPTLHAKCYMNENSAIISSLNLYEFSQQNNEEMGFYIKNEDSGSGIFAEIQTEVIRLFDSPLSIKKAYLELQEGQKYSVEQLEEIFNFEYKGRAGIKKAVNGEIVLFSSPHGSPYEDTEDGNTLYYQGQNTGAGEQKLIYGNKDLYSAYLDKSVKIHLLKNYVYSGTYEILSEPYIENGKWVFPLTRAI